MNEIPLRHLTLIDQLNGTFEHESGIRMNKRQLMEVTDLHWHNYFEIEFVLSGTGINVFNGNKYEIKAGTIFMLTPADFHQVIPIDNLNLCTVMFNDNTINQDLMSHVWSLDYDRRTMQLAPQNSEKIALLLELMLAKLQDKGSFKKEYIQNLLECIFITILQCAENGNDLLNHSHFNTPIQHALSYLHSHFRESLSLSEVAAISRYTPNYFCEIFKKTTGKTYNKYLNDLKLNFARQLLASSSLSITEICYASGFSSLSHFLRLFKSVYGVSPNRMRAQSPEA